jgi:hypothetical protein
VRAPLLSVVAQAEQSLRVAAQAHDESLGIAVKVVSPGRFVGWLAGGDSVFGQEDVRVVLRQEASKMTGVGDRSTSAAMDNNLTHADESSPRVGRQLLSIAETQEAFGGIARETLYQYFKAGLRTVKIRGRRFVDVADLQDFIDRHRDVERLGESEAFSAELRRLAAGAPEPFRSRLVELAEDAGETALD